MKLVTKIWLSCYLIISCYSSLTAQEYAIRHFNTETGLDGSYVYMTIEGDQGYKWVSTSNGLFRFDGLKFEAIERNDSTKMKFPTTSVATRDGSILMGYYNGEIKRYNDAGVEIVYNQINSPIISIVEDDSVIWALTQNKGLLRIQNGKTQQFEPKELQSKKSNVLIIYENMLLVGTNEGLHKYLHTDSEKLKYLGQIEIVKGLSVQCLVKSKKGAFFWLGIDDRGLFKLNLTEGTLKGVQEDYLKDMSIIALKETDNLDLWIGTKYDGLIKIDFNREKMREVQFTYMNTENGFPSDQISGITFDKDENLWVGTVDEGLVQIFKKGIVFYDFKKYKVTSVNCISGSKQNEFFFGTDVGIIKASYTRNVDSLKFEIINHPHINKQPVTAIYTNEQDRVYFSTKGKGLYSADVNFEEVEAIPFEHNMKRIKHITQDAEGLIWLSVMNNGVFVIDTLGNVKNHYAIKTGFYHNEIYDIHIDKKGNKWFAAHAAGLAVMKPNGEIKYLTRDGKFPARDINDISEDENGNIWIGTYGNGVYEFDGKSFVRFDTNNGLLNNYCNSLISDRNNHVWVGHRLGLSRIDENTNAISTIEQKDGLSALEFITQSVYRDHEHNIWLGNRAGVTFLSTPDEMFEPQILNTLITDVKIDFKSVDLYEYSSSDQTANKVPDDMTLPYDQNNLTFEFVAINLKKPESTLYQFKLEGYNTEWSPVTSVSEITYTNLPPGAYDFVVRQSDNPNHWEENITKLSFVITPPWWSTWLARITFSLIVIGIIIMILRFRMIKRIRRIKNKQRYLEITENQNARLKNFAFITSHNTRSSVVNLVGLVRILEEDPNNKEYFSLVKKTVEKLNLTIEHIGELLNFENEITRVKQTECSVIETIERVIVLNSSLIKENSADLHVNIPYEMKVNAVPAYMESVFNNLITNAIRYGTTKTEKRIDVFAELEGGKVSIFVKDNGLGIDMEAHKDKLFELGSRFHSSRSDGQGMGLFMSKYQLEAMNGTIHIDSEINKGTTVRVDLALTL